jgi:hypothetical protein
MKKSNAEIAKELLHVMDTEGNKSLVKHVNDYCEITFLEGEGNMKHFIFRGPRSIILEFLSRTEIYSSFIGVTQASTRRKVVECMLEFVGEHPEIAADRIFAYRKYLYNVANGMELDDAKKDLPLSSPSVVFVSYPSVLHKEIDPEVDYLRSFCRGTNRNSIRPDVKNTVFQGNMLKSLDYPKMFMDLELDYEHPIYAAIGCAMVYDMDISDQSELTKDANAYLANIVKRGHTSVLEHIGVTFTSFMTDETYNQLIRHRHKISTVLKSSRDVTIGKEVLVKVDTNMRELLAMITERTCTVAQKDIANIYNSIHSLILKDDDKHHYNSNILKDRIGPKCLRTDMVCTEGVKCKGHQLKSFRG